MLRNGSSAVPYAIFGLALAVFAWTRVTDAQTRDVACEAPFAAAWDFQAGERPGSVIMGDLNGDGEADLVAANVASNDLTVFTSVGDGRFDTRTIELPVLSRLEILVAADFNGDGTLDLAFGHSSTRRVELLPGDGAGGFGELIPSPTGVTPLGFSPADMDGDGDIDLAVRTVSAVRLLRNNGTGLFELTDTVLRVPFAQELDCGDADGDGDLDVAVTSLGPVEPQILLFFNDGSGDFSEPDTYPTGVFPAATAFGDLDGDGDLDLAWTQTVSGLVCTRLNEAGVFIEPRCTPAGGMPESLVLADSDGDGDADIAVADTDGSRVLVFSSLDDGVLAPAIALPVGREPRQIVAGDINGDGALDLAVPNWLSDDVTVLLNDGSGEFPVPAQFPTGLPDTWGLVDVDAGDLDGDGDEDLLLSVTSRPRVDVLRQTEDGLEHFQSVALGGSIRQLKLADLDLDGDLDAVAQTDQGDALETLINDGSRGFRPTARITIEARSPMFELVDADGDGHQDAVVLLDRDRLLVAYNNGLGVFDDRLVLDVVDRSDSMAAGDLDGNGRLDVVVGTTGSDRSVMVFELVDHQLVARWMMPISFNSRVLGLTDVDADGQADVVIADGTNRSIVFWPGDGRGGLGVRREINSGQFTFQLEVGDVTSDKASDLIAGVAGGLQVLTNRGRGEFSAGPVLRTGEVIGGFALADLDGDGLTDIAASDLRAPTLPVLLSRCPRPCPIDFDGDGILTVFDFLCFQNLFIAGDPSADLDGDGELTPLDFLAFLNAFDAGCP